MDVKTIYEYIIEYNGKTSKVKGSNLRTIIDRLIKMEIYERDGKEITKLRIKYDGISKNEKYRQKNKKQRIN